MHCHFTTRWHEKMLWHSATYWFCSRIWHQGGIRKFRRDVIQQPSSGNGLYSRC